MICILALIVFSIMSIFSAKHRPFARAAFDCVFRKMTLRPCNTGMDEKIKADIVAFFLKRFPPAAKFVNFHFEAISWAFTLLFFASLIYTIYGAYNFATTGTCDPTNPSAFCIYRDVLGTSNQTVCHDPLNATAQFNPSSLIPPKNPIGIFSGNSSSKIMVVEFACFSCPFTKQVEDGVRSLLQNKFNEVNFVTVPFPIPTHPHSREASLAVLCAANPSPGGYPALSSAAPYSRLATPINQSISSSPNYWNFRQAIFTRQPDLQANGMDAIIRAAQDSNMPAEFYSCLNNSEKIYGQYLDARILEGKAAGIYGTPTFFVNNKAIVGITNYNELSNAVDAVAKNN